MPRIIHCSEPRPKRQMLSWDETWMGPDQGLIACWERGREMRITEPELASQAEQGELITLPWKGGTENIDQDKEKIKKTQKPQKRFGTLNYLAMWQGLRGEDLSVDLDGEQVIACTKTKRTVIFRLTLPPNMLK